MITESIEEIYKLQRQYRHFSEIVFSQDVDQSYSHKFNIKIRLEANDHEKAAIEMFFYDCLSIKMDDFERLFSIFLIIEDIRTHQLEGIYYKVNYTEDFITFLCRDFSVCQIKNDGIRNEL